MMKIIIAIIYAMMLMPIMADAQIQVKKQPQIETIKSIRMGYVTLTKSQDIYCLCLTSDNQFDKAYVIMLGKGKEAAVQSLNSLIEVASTITKKDTFEFNDGIKDFRIYRGMLKNEVWFKADGYAGYGKTSKAELNQLLESILFVNAQ